MNSFTIKIPNDIEFGQGTIEKLPEKILRFGNDVLIFTGENSLYCEEKSEGIFNALDEKSISYRIYKVKDEPTVSSIDEICALYRKKLPSVIVGIGGGSVLDTAKAVRSIILQKESVLSYLPFGGNKSLDKKAIPMIAVPTTAGTGSEATNNAVIAQYGPNHFKNSLRADILLPNVAIIDPELTVSCPFPVTAYSGMDAFCQLLEAYTSTASNEFTDSLMIQGLEKITRNLKYACFEGSSDITARSNLSYAALLSGIGIMNSSTTVIHGFASPIGALYRIPHGAICASILFAATLTNMRKIQKYDLNSPSTAKFAQIGSILSGIEYSYDKHDVLLRAVTEKLKTLTTDLKIPTLSQLGVKKEDFYNIVSTTKLNGNPAELAEVDLMEILEMSY